MGTEAVLKHDSDQRGVKERKQGPKKKDDTMLKSATRLSKANAAMSRRSPTRCMALKVGEKVSSFSLHLPREEEPRFQRRMAPSFSSSTGATRLDARPKPTTSTRSTKSFQRRESRSLAFLWKT